MTETLLFFHQLPGNPSEETYALIGQIVVQSAEIDFHLAATLRYMLESDRAEILTAGQSFKFIFDSIRALIKHHIPEDRRSELEELLKECADLHETRNWIAHATWAPVEKELAFEITPSEHSLSLSRRWQVDPRQHRFTVSALQDIAVQCYDTALKVKRFNDYILEDIDPVRPDRPRTW